MKKKIFFYVVFVFVVFITIIYIVNSLPKEEVQAASSGSNSDIQLLARAINGEARGEPYEGQVAIGAVILNRVKDSRIQLQELFISQVLLLRYLMARLIKLWKMKLQ